MALMYGKEKDAEYEIGEVCTQIERRVESDNRVQITLHIPGFAPSSTSLRRSPLKLAPSASSTGRTTTQLMDQTHSMLRPMSIEQTP